MNNRYKTAHWAYLGRMLSFLFLCLSANAYGQCTMSCNNQVNVSLPNTCEGEITYQMMLSGGYNDPNNCQPGGAANYEVVVMTNTGAPIPTSPIVTAVNIGRFYTVKVKHIPSGNSCWGSIYVQDYSAPTLVCPPDITVDCTAPTTPAQLGQPTVSDCSSYILTYTDAMMNMGCVDPMRTIQRTWRAVDNYGNVATCTQNITVRLATLASISFPVNVDGISSPMLNCINPDTSAANTGMPTINGFAIPNGATCRLAITRSNQVIPICGNTYKVLRTWTAVSWCESTVRTHLQIIKVGDNTPPTMSCPATLVLSTTSQTSCRANLLLPAITVTDACSSPVTVTVQTPWGVVNGNGGAVNNVPIGTYTITYKATDACGNFNTCTTSLTIRDQTAPTVVCDAVTVITLPNTGEAFIPAMVFDDGSYDNCCLDKFEVRRMVAGCGVGTAFGPTVKVCCADVGRTIMVEMRVTDCYGNSNSCMVQAVIRETTPPTITCPSNRTIQCTQSYTNLSLTGSATATDNCGGVDTLFYTDQVNLNACGLGQVVRTWRARDFSGLWASCQQTITVVDPTPITIRWPRDTTVTACISIAQLTPALLPAPYNSPLIIADCELTSTNFHDRVFTNTSNACIKIERTWTIHNDCIYNPNTNAGVSTYVQTIKVVDNQAPVISCPVLDTVRILGATCSATVTIPLPQVTDCSPNPTITITTPWGTGTGPFNNVPQGTYTIQFRASDNCGNTSNCTRTLVVVDRKAPTPYCKNGLIVELTPIDNDGDGIPDGAYGETWASDFDAGSSDNCSGVQFSFSSDVNDTGLFFDCDDAGQSIPIQMWVTDAAGNQAFCSTFVQIQDNNFACVPILPVGGRIATEDLRKVQGVSVSTNDPNVPMAMTDSAGNYALIPMLTGNDYTIAPSRTNDFLNGITTFDILVISRHILNIELLDSPYKIIASDVNFNGQVTTADLVALRRLVLLVDTSFVNNKPSWRFVDRRFAFTSPMNPFADVFPEVYNINNLQSQMTAVDFVAIKVGDVTGNAQTQSMYDPSLQNRNLETTQIELPTSRLEKGSIYTVKIPISEGLASMQSAWAFDEAILRPISSNSKGMESVIEAGQWRWSWISSNSNPTEALNFSFEVLASIDLAEALRLDNQVPALLSSSSEESAWQILWRDSAPIVQKSTSNSVLTISPNPVLDRIVWIFESDWQPTSWVLNTLDGRLVSSGRIEGASFGKNVVPRSIQWSAGVYYLTLYNGDKKVTSKLMLL